MEFTKSKKRKMSHTLNPPIVESAVVNSIKIEKLTNLINRQYAQLSEKIESVEQRIETEDSLRSTILSQQHQIEELRQHIKHIEDKKQGETKNFDYFL